MGLWLNYALLDTIYAYSLYYTGIVDIIMLYLLDLFYPYAIMVLDFRKGINGSGQSDSSNSPGAIDHLAKKLR